MTMLTAGFDGMQCPVADANIKLLAGKVYRLSYVTGNYGCAVKNGLANTMISLKGLI